MSRNFLLAGLLMAVLSITAAGQKLTGTVVTSKIFDQDSLGAAYLLSSDLAGGVNSTTYVNGSNSVVSQIQGVGDWELDMLGSATRRVNVSFAGYVSGSNPDPVNRPTPPSGAYNVRFIAKCTDRNAKFTTIALNTSVKCPVTVAVDIGTSRFSLRFNEVNWVPSTDIGWTCTAFAGGKCTAWKADSADNGGVYTARVLKITTSKGKTVETDYGLYRFSLQISLTAQ